MNKRDFIKTSLVGTLGMMGAPVFANSARNFSGNSPADFKLPPLPYAYDALEPFMDRETLLLHHTHYHAGYTDRFNASFVRSGMRRITARKILSNASAFDKELVYNGGGYLNHKLFWNSLSPSGAGKPRGELAIAIDRSFGSFTRFKEQFGNAARQIPEQGWVWLISQHNNLKIITTINHHNPFMNIIPAEKRGFPLLCLDLGNDAYFPLTQEKRDAYITGWWDYVNWDKAAQRYANRS